MFNRIIQAVSVLGISVVLLLTVVGLASRTDIANAAPPRAEDTVKRQITVSGTGRVSAQPDEAVITIGVQFTAPTLGEATKQANDAMTKVLDAIKAQGIDSKEIQTSNYSVTPVMSYKEGEPSKVTGYQVSNIVTVKVKKLDTLGKVLDAGMGAGANYLGGVFFGVDDPSPYEKDARTAAVKDATQIAQTLASAAGVKLGTIVSIAEGVINTPPPVPAGRVFAADAASPGPVETGSMDITTNVVMVFEISE
jgi:uncharacterized protein YggE